MMDQITQRNYLVVDDSEVDAMLAVEALHHIGVKTNITSAASADAALNFLARNLVHVVITDLEMPGMDGKKLVEAIRDRGITSHLKVIMTTSVDTHELQDFLQKHGVKYLKKGYRPDDLLHVLQELNA